MKKPKLRSSPAAKSASKNPFKSYQQGIVNGREQIIARYLASLRKTRAKFEYVTDLAKAVAEQVAMAEAAPCSFTTLLRNKRYKALLLNFQATRAGTKEVSVTEPAALARIHAAELDLGNVGRDNQRLRSYIADLEAQLAHKPTLPSAITDSTDWSDRLLELSNEKAFACKALWIVLNHFKELASIDTERGCIIDLAASKRNNVIVNPETARVFLDWMRSNAGIGK